MNLNFVLGTAAELIKVYPVIHLALERGYQVRVLSTGQSRENFLMQYRDLGLPESAFATLIESAGDLERASSALRWFARAILMGKRRFRDKLLTGPRSFVLVHGDTLSTLVGSWQARRCGLPVVHIEAGLRSPSLFNPFPEEITRRLVSRLASYHMAPDARAAGNLRSARGNVLNTGGNTLLDAVLLSAKLAHGDLPAEPFALVNIHRFENLNSAARWAKALDVVREAALQTKLIFVCHPQTRHKLDNDADARAKLSGPNIELRDRMPFSQFIALLKKSEYLITDGGSNQEECSYLGKPCLILREATERQEGLGGCCVLSRFDAAVIGKFMRDPLAYRVQPVELVVHPSAAILDTLARSLA